MPTTQYLGRYATPVGTTAVTLPATPAAGDLVLVIGYQGAGGGRSYTPSGLGVTSWSSPTVISEAFNGGGNTFFYGVAGATNPNLSVTTVGSDTITLVYLVSGLSAPAIEKVDYYDIGGTQAIGQSLPLASMPMYPRAGQVVIAGISIPINAQYQSYDFPDSGAQPATGWTVDYARSSPSTFSADLGAMHHDGIDGLSPVLAQITRTAAIGNNGVNGVMGWQVLCGLPSEERVISSYTETLTKRNPALAINAEYVETLTQRNPALVLGGQYIEVMSQGITTITVQQAYLEYMTGPPVVTPTELYMHGWGLVIPGS